MTNLPPLSEEAQGFTPGVYKHFKGGTYHALCVARSSEAPEEEYVVYRSAESGLMWVRPLAMFLETVDLNGTLRPRFAWIAPLPEDDEAFGA